jgi:hypothetical protein
LNITNGNGASFKKYTGSCWKVTHYDINTNVVDTSVVQYGDSHSSLEIYDCLEELETLGLIKMLQPIGDTKYLLADDSLKSSSVFSFLR